MPESSPVAAYLTRRRWTVTEARAALAALDASGLRATAFAARVGLDVQRLHSWRRKFGATSKTRSKTGPKTRSKNRPKTKPKTKPARASRSKFVELRPRGAEPVEIVLRSGRVLRVTESIDAAVLRRLVEVLDEPSPSPC